MKIGIIAVGRMKSGPERALADRYLERFAKSGPPLGLEFAGTIELAESRAGNAERRKVEEAEAVHARLADGCVTVLLDERGKNLNSEAFATQLGSWRDAGQKAAFLLIGGPDGHDAMIRSRASLVLSFGAQTWPHQLIRIMAAEQLYRAATILSGHPYHRA